MTNQQYSSILNPQNFVNDNKNLEYAFANFNVPELSIGRR